MLGCISYDFHSRNLKRDACRYLDINCELLRNGHEWKHARDVFKLTTFLGFGFAVSYVRDDRGNYIVDGDEMRRRLSFGFFRHVPRR